MSLDLIIAVAVVFGPMVLIVALMVRTAGPVLQDHRATRRDVPGDAGLRWPTDEAVVSRGPSGPLPAERLLPSLYERNLRHG